MLFSAVLLVWHTVDAYDLMMRNHDVHVVTHLTFMVTAVLLWWPVTSPSATLPRLKPGMGMLYLFLVQLPMQLLGAIITFADAPLYPWYSAAPRTWGLSPLDDQKLGGLLMWIPGNLWIWGAMSVLFFQWARSGSAKRTGRRPVGQSAVVSVCPVPVRRSLLPANVSQSARRPPIHPPLEPGRPLLRRAVGEALGFTRPLDIFWIRSSPTAAAALSPSSTSPVSRMPCAAASCPHTPA